MTSYFGQKQLSALDNSLPILHWLLICILAALVTVLPMPTQSQKLPNITSIT